MSRSVGVHAGLLGAGLVSAYLVWTREPETQVEEVIPIVNLRGGVDKLSLSEPERKVEIERRKDGAGPYYWVKVDKMVPEAMKAPPRPASPAAAAGKPAPPKPAPPVKAAARKTPFKAPSKAGRPFGKSPKRDEVRRKAEAPPKRANSTPPMATAKSPAARTPAIASPAGASASPSEAKANPSKAAPVVGKGPQRVPVKPAGAANATNAPGAARTTAAAKKPKTKKVRKVQEFKGNKATTELMERMAKLPAIRALGTVSDDKLKEYELANSKKLLTLVSGSTTRSFTIGGTTYGHGDVYLQDKEDKRVYVIRAVNELKYAEYRLVDRELLGLETSEIGEATVTGAVKGSSGRQTLVQHNRLAKDAAFWNKQGGEVKRTDPYHTWMNKLLRMRVLEFVQAKDKPEKLSTAFEVTFSRGSKKLGRLTISKTTQKKDWKVANKSGGEEYFASSDHTRALVKISRPQADSLSRDLPSILKN